MALYLVRHGQTDWNLQRRFQSISDIPLNATGTGQARLIRDEFERRRLEFVAARSSPLSRAMTTAGIILEGRRTLCCSDERLREVSLGDFEGRREADLRRSFGEAYDRWRESFFTVAAPNGESLAEAAERVIPALADLEPAATAGDVLIVAHQGINMAIKIALSGTDDMDRIRRFTQGNDEVDVWDMAQGDRIDHFTIDVA